MTGQEGRRLATFAIKRYDSVMAPVELHGLNRHPVGLDGGQRLTAAPSCIVDVNIWGVLICQRQLGLCLPSLQGLTGSQVCL